MKQKSNPIKSFDEHEDHYRFHKSCLALIAAFMIVPLLCIIAIGIFIGLDRVCLTSIPHDYNMDAILDSGASTLEILQDAEARVAQNSFYIGYTGSNYAYADFTCSYMTCALSKLSFDVNVHRYLTPLCRHIREFTSEGGTTFFFDFTKPNVTTQSSMGPLAEHSVNGAKTIHLSEIRPSMEEVIARSNTLSLASDYRVVIRSRSDRWLVKIESDISNVEYEVLYQRIENE